MKKRFFLLTIILALSCSACAEHTNDNVPLNHNSEYEDISIIDEKEITNYETDNNLELKVEGKEIIDVVANNDYILLLTKDGYVYAEGNNETGALCQGDFNEYKDMVKIDFPEKIMMIDDCVAVGESNNVYIWGVAYYAHKQYNQCDVIPYNPLSSCTPSINIVHFDQDIKYIHKSDDFINILTDKGEVYTYGAYCKYDLFNDSDEPAAGINIYPTDKFVEVPFDEKIIKISCGAQHTLALSESGNVYGFGSSYWGQIGRNQIDKNNYFKFDYKNVKDIFAAGYNSFILTEDDILLCYGTLSREAEEGKIEIKIPEKIEAAYPSRLFSVSFLCKESVYRLITDDIYEKTFEIVMSEDNRLYIENDIYVLNGKFYITQDMLQRLHADKEYDEIID